MVPVITRLSAVTRSWTAVTGQTSPTAHSTAAVACSNVATESVSLNATSATMTTTVETGVTNRTAPIPLAEGATSLAPVVAVFTKSGFVMEKTTVKTMQMRKAVMPYHVSAILENGPVRPRACVSPWTNCVMGQPNVQMERMRPAPLLDATAVSGGVPR